MIRQLIREMLLQEKVLSDVSPLKDIPDGVNKSFYGGGGLSYGDKETTSWRRNIKKDWNTHADQSFFQDPKQLQIVHFLGFYSGKLSLQDYFSGIDNMYIDAGVKAGLLRTDDESVEMFMTDPEFYHEISKKLPNAIRLPGVHYPSKDELSCYGYAPPKPTQELGREPFFTFRKYRVTFASNKDAATERLSNAKLKDRERMSSSGLAKRPNALYHTKDAPLDRQGLENRGHLEEVVIDNWVIDTYHGPSRDGGYAKMIGLKHVAI